MGLIISFILSIFAPNISSEACGVILGLIPTDVIAAPADTCECQVGVGGGFSVDLAAAASCPIVVNGQDCDLTVTGGGGALTLLLGGNGALTFSSTCDFGVGDFEFSADGIFATDDVSVTSCALAIDNNEGSLTCECGAVGCDDGDFTALVTCSMDGNVVGSVDGECVNFAALAEFLGNELIE